MMTILFKGTSLDLNEKFQNTFSRKGKKKTKHDFLNHNEPNKLVKFTIIGQKIREHLEN